MDHCQQQKQGSVDAADGGQVAAALCLEKAGLRDGARSRSTHVASGQVCEGGE